jgi:hypothetical protein
MKTVPSAEMSVFTSRKGVTFQKSWKFNQHKCQNFKSRLSWNRYTGNYILYYLFFFESYRDIWICVLLLLIRRFNGTLLNAKIIASRMGSESYMAGEKKGNLKEVVVANFSALQN